MNILNFDDFIIKLNEGLILTHSINKNEDVLKRYLNHLGLQFEITIKPLKETFSILLFTTKLHIYELIFIECRNLGYYPSSFTPYFRFEHVVKNKIYNEKDFKNDIDKSNFQQIEIFFESKFDEIYKLKPYHKYLYHGTPSYKASKILDVGLKPSSLNRNSYHPGRVYFSLNINDCKSIITEFIDNDYERWINTEEIYKNRIQLDDYTILKIDTTDYKNIDFRKDPKSSGIYTYDYITPKRISVECVVENIHKNEYTDWLKNNSFPDRTKFL